MESLKAIFAEYEKVLVGLAAIAAVFALFGGFLTWFFGLWGSRKPNPDSANMPQSDGIPAKDVSMLLGDQQDRHEDQQKQHDNDLAKINKKYKKLKTASKEEQQILNAEIAELQRREANPEKALEEAQETIAKLKAAIDREANTLSGDAAEKAKQALEAGDADAATKLFEEIKARTALDVEASARASLALGKIADQEVRWNDAFAHFSEAARLRPCFNHLIRAQKMAHNLADYAEAERLARLALAAAEREYGKAEQYSNSLNNLAELLRATSRFDEAEPLYRQALENTRQTMGEDHPTFGICLNNLALLLQDTDHFEEAEPLFRQALENARRTLGKTHPYFGTSLNNLANLLKNTGRFNEAEPLYRQAVEVLEKSLGPDHPDTIRIKRNLEIFLTERPPKN